MYLSEWSRYIIINVIQKELAWTKFGSNHISKKIISYKIQIMKFTFQ